MNLKSRELKINLASLNTLFSNKLINYLVNHLTSHYALIILLVIVETQIAQLVDLPQLVGHFLNIDKNTLFRQPTLMNAWFIGLFST